MRLWHKDLIPVLPRQQLLGQWRELCAIMTNIMNDGTPNHVLVNKIMDYPLKHLLEYALEVQDEMKMRGYKCDFDKFADKYRASTLSQNGSNLVVWHDDLYEGWHNERYLTQCYYNLQEKYDCGGITEDEWQKIDTRYKELMDGKTFVPEVKRCFVDDLIELANDLERVKDGSLGAPWLEDLGEIAKRIRYYCGVDEYVN